jgi:CRISPR-associated protein Csb1
MTTVANPIDYSMLKDAPRLLMEAKLKPLQGHRFQPTGFADLGPARYTLPDGTEMLLVESVQSVANRMELACCQEDKRMLLTELMGLPHVVSKSNGETLTASYLEAHRLSSPYLLNDEWATRLASDMNLRDNFALNDPAIFRTLFKYDPACLLHGVWLSLKQYKDKFSGGRVRVVRTLSGFIEAERVSVAEYGGTKFDKNFARTEENADAETGYGTLPFHRTEFVAAEIKAYFNLDLALLRGYGLSDDATKLLIALSLFKVRRFLSTGLRLRTACDLEMIGDVTVMRPNGFQISDEKTLLNECIRLIEKCKSLFADPPITEVEWKPGKKKDKKKDKKKAGDNEQQAGDEKDQEDNDE